MPIATTGLAALKSKIAVLMSARLVPELAQRVAATTQKLTTDTFRNQSDPYGNHWPPLAKERPRNKRARLKREKKGLKSRGTVVLVDTGRMRASANSQASREFVRVNVSAVYSIFHQGGTARIPRRMMIPDEGLGMPSKWDTAINREADKLIREKLRGAR